MILLKITHIKLTFTSSIFALIRSYQVILTASKRSADFKTRGGPTRKLSKGAQTLPQGVLRQRKRVVTRLRGGSVFCRIQPSIQGSRPNRWIFVMAKEGCMANSQLAIERASTQREAGLIAQFGTYNRYIHCSTRSEGLGDIKALGVSTFGSLIMWIYSPNRCLTSSLCWR